MGCEPVPDGGSLSWQGRSVRHDELRVAEGRVKIGDIARSWRRGDEGPLALAVPPSPAGPIELPGESRTGARGIDLGYPGPTAVEPACQADTLGTDCLTVPLDTYGCCIPFPAGSEPMLGPGRTRTGRE